MHQNGNIHSKYCSPHIGICLLWKIRREDLRSRRPSYPRRVYGGRRRLHTFVRMENLHDTVPEYRRHRSHIRCYHGYVVRSVSLSLDSLRLYLCRSDARLFLRHALHPQRRCKSAGAGGHLSWWTHTPCDACLLRPSACHGGRGVCPQSCGLALFAVERHDVRRPPVLDYRNLRILCHRNDTASR